MSTFAEIRSQILPSQPSQVVDLADNGAALTVAQVQEFIAAGVRFGDDDVITITDNAAALEGLRAEDIADIAGMGGSSLVATDRGLDLTLAQISALADGAMAAFSRYETVSETSPDDTRVNTSTNGNQSRQTITALADGGYAVTWQSYQEGGDKNGIYTQRFDAEGIKIGGETRVNTFTGGNQTFPTIAKLADGGYVIVWQSSSQDGSSSGIYAQKFDAGGNPVGSEMQVNTETNGAQSQGNVTALADGRYAVTWVNQTDGTVRAQIFGADGDAMGGEIDAGTGYQANDLLSIGITLLSNGRFVIVWPALGASGTADVHAQLVDADGVKIGGPFLVNSHTPSTQHNAKLSALPGGGFVVTWVSFVQDDELRGIYAQLFDGSGNPIGEETLVPATFDGVQSDQTVTALAGGGYVVSWLSWDGSSTGVYSQMFDAAGAKVGGETRVNTTTHGEQGQQQVLALPGGGFAVTWASPLLNSDVIFIQIMDAQGQKVGGETLVTVNAHKLESKPQISVLANGDIVLAWRALDGSGLGVFTKRFTHDTEKVSFKAAADVISALTAGDVANFADLGVRTVKVADAGAVSLTKDIALSLSAEDLEIAGAASVTVTGSGASLDDLSVSQIASLRALGVTAMDVTDQAIALTLAQAGAFVTAGIGFAGNDTVTIKLTAGDLADLTAGNISSLAQMGASVLDHSGNEASLTIARAGLLMDAGLRFAAGDVITIADTAANVAGLADADIIALGAWGVSVIDLTNGEITLTAGSIGKFVTAGIRFAANDMVVVEDSAAGIQGLGAADISAFAHAGVDGVRSLDGDVTLSTAQFVAFGAHGVSVDAGTRDVKVAGTGADIAALGTNAIAYFSALGIASLDVSNDQVVLSLAQANAFRSAGVHFSGSDAITLSLSGSQAASLSSATVTAFAGFGVKSIATAESGLAFTAAQVSAFSLNGIAFAVGYQAMLADKANVLLNLAPSAVDIYRSVGIDGVQLADSGSAIAGLTVANITALSRLGVNFVDVTDGAVSLTMARAMEFASNGMVFDRADTVASTATAASLKDPDITDIPALKSINIDMIDVSDNNLVLSLAQANAYVGAGIGFVASDAITVKLSFSEAKALNKATAGSLHAAGVDRIEIDMTPQQLASLTYGQLKEFLAAGIDGISNVQLLNFGSFTYDLVTHRINYAPVIASNGGGTSASINVAENTTAVTKVVATDANAGMALTYSIVGGADQGLFTIDVRTGMLSFKAAPDFESPKDAGKDNFYDVTVRASDGQLTDTQTIRIKVTDVKGYAYAGTSGADRMTGSAEHDLLDGKAGADIMAGGKGNDTYIVDSAGDRVVELANEGTDLVRASVSHTLASNVENLTLTGSSAINGAGNMLANLLVGNAANNVLDGRAGADVMSGGKGNDTYVVDNTADRVVELANEGIDLVKAFVSHTLSSNVENLTLVGLSAINGAGNSLANLLVGNAANNVLDGGAGADAMSGGKGNDTYIVDNTGDRVIELANQGIDLVRASVNHTLAANVENLVLMGSGNLSGIGNTLANSIIGNAGRNVLDGGAGNDVLKGNAGNDRLIGGLGADQLFGGAGADVFVFKSVKETTVAVSGQDTIFDFSRREGDLIDLRAIDANIGAGGDQAFTFIGADAFHRKAGELRYEKKGGFTYVAGDIQGDGTADFTIKFQGAIDFGKSDFVL